MWLLAQLASSNPCTQPIYVCLYKKGASLLLQRACFTSVHSTGRTYIHSTGTTNIQIAKLCSLAAPTSLIVVVLVISVSQFIFTNEGAGWSVHKRCLAASNTSQFEATQQSCSGYCACPDLRYCAI